jgi:hypothetical protein
LRIFRFYEVNDVPPRDRLWLVVGNQHNWFRCGITFDSRS